MRHVPCFSRVVSVQSNQSWPQSTWHVAPRRAQAGPVVSTRSRSAEACRATTSWSCLTAAALGAGDFGCGALALGAGAGGVSSDALSGRFSHLMTSSSPSLASSWWNSSLPQGSANVTSAVPGPVASQLRTVRFAQVLPLFTSTRSPRFHRNSDFLAFGSGAARTLKPSIDAARSRVTLTKVSTFLSV